MKNVSEVLSAYRKELKAQADHVVLGNSESNLESNLRKVVDRNRFVVYVILGMLIVTFLLAIGFIWYWRDNTTVLIGIFTATGITFTWIINTVIGLWREISKAETIHVMVAHLNDPETTRNLIKILSENIYQSPQSQKENQQTG